MLKGPNDFGYQVINCYDCIDHISSPYHSSATFAAAAAFGAGTASSFFFGLISILSLIIASVFFFSSFINFSFCFKRSFLAFATKSSSSYAKLNSTITCRVLLDVFFSLFLGFDSFQGFELALTEGVCFDVVDWLLDCFEVGFEVLEELLEGFRGRQFLVFGF